ncbi:MAG: ATP-binding protein [Planctomycetota bacterium]
MGRYGSYPPSGGLGGLSEAMLGKFGSTNLEGSMRPYLTETPALVATFAALIRHESPPTGADPLGGDALQSVVVHLMRALAKERPTIWIVDDLHFAPQESVDLLLAMARAVEDHRILVIATARPGVALEDFSRLQNFRRLVLARLSARAVIQLLQEAFRSAVLAERLGGKIALKSDGVPFFVFEMIRGLKEGQFIRQQPDGTYVQTQIVTEIEVPSAVKDLIEGRLRGLTEDQRAILDVGAVQGLTFEPGLVAHVLEEKRVRVLRDLAEIERRLGLVRDEGEAVRFDQNQIQEILYQGLTPHLRAEYHTLLAEAYAERCGDEPEGRDAYFLARNHLYGSRPKRALAHLEPALEHLQKSYRNDSHLALARRALDTPGLLAGAERIDVLLRLAGRLALIGRPDERRVAVDEAVALADETGDVMLRARARQTLGYAQHQANDHAAAEVTLREALDLAIAANDRKIEGWTRNALGLVCHRVARYAEAREHLEESIAIFREIEFRPGEMTTIGNLGLVFFGLGQYEKAREHFARNRDLGIELGDRRAETIGTGNLGIVFASLGRLAEASEHYERQLALARQTGNRTSEAICLGNLGITVRRLGRLAEARERHQRQRALVREIGHARGDGFALEGLASVAEAEGDTAEAIRLCEEALALRRKLGEKARVAGSLATLGRLEADQGRTERATTYLDEALALALETGSPGVALESAVTLARLPGGDVQAALAALADHEQHAAQETRMEARLGLWELTGDPAHLAEAHRLLEDLRAHAPEKDRDSMVENVPLHRAIARAWREHGT